MSEIEKRKRKAGITAYNYNSICDIYGCSNMARVSLGIKDYGPGTKYNICNECLEDIVSVAPISIVMAGEDVQKHIESYAREIASDIPIELIFERPDVQKYIVEQIKVAVAEATELVESANTEFSLKPEDIVPETPNEFYGVGLIEPLIALSNKPEDITSSKDGEDEMALLKAKSWNDLRAFAKELTIEGYGTMKRGEMELAILERLRSGDA